MPIGADMDGRGGEMQPERDLSEETALAGGEMEGLRRRSQEDEESCRDLLSADWSSWMALLHFVVQLRLFSSLWAGGRGLFT